MTIENHIFRLHSRNRLHKDLGGLKMENFNPYTHVKFKIHLFLQLSCEHCGMESIEAEKPLGKQNTCESLLQQLLMLEFNSPISNRLLKRRLILRGYQGTS
ncbi:hypothetical protein AAHA92_22466 [Salvia divinorum]|uniref:Transposase IS204/IS1001/IS1096/IS1165 zinc-finger domain-containing protein n=1 Tax=Salvia divinorum TaxID=28513 RepID=A0ABD1GNS2_SALDI